MMYSHCTSYHSEVHCAHDNNLLQIVKFCLVATCNLHNGLAIHLLIWSYRTPTGAAVQMMNSITSKAQKLSMSVNQYFKSARVTLAMIFLETDPAQYSWLGSQACLALSTALPLPLRLVHRLSGEKFRLEPFSIRVQRYCYRRIISYGCFYSQSGPVTYSVPK